MEPPQSPSTGGRRHNRVSVPILRRNTKGPLDEGDDPLATPAETQSPSSPPLDPPRQSTETARPPTPPAKMDGLSAEQVTKSALDLGFLRNPNLYHSLSTEDVPEAFLDSTRQPPASASLAELLRSGSFRRAASVATSQMVETDLLSVEHILQLLYIRLACLVLISRPDIAAQEAHPLTDLLGRNPAGAKELLPSTPWELRLLMVRLQSVNASDGGRRCVMSLYALANEVRSQLATARAAGDDADADSWKVRLEDLGLRVADVLVEMGELATARRHLDTLVTTNPGEIVYRKALLSARVGDMSGAQQCVNQLEDGHRKLTLNALLLVANGETSAAVGAWKDIMKDDTSQALAVTNMAVGLLYAGDIIGARDVFETAVNTLPSFPGLLFNLSTVYELCTERGIELKTALTQRLAMKPQEAQSGGWERTNFDLKL